MDASIELYELNRSIIEQQGIIKEEDITRAMTDIKYLVTAFDNKCYMLYGKEIGYFTLFMRAGQGQRRVLRKQRWSSKSSKRRNSANG